MEETWKSVKGYEGLYEVSNIGRIKSLGNDRTRKERILKMELIGGGYPAVSFYKNGKQKVVTIHKIMAIAFLNHTPDGHKIVVDHINGDKADNRVENLRLVTQRFNCSVGYRKNKDKFASKYVGVCWSNTAKKWQSRILVEGRLIYMGLFINEIEASNAYQKELLKIT